MSDQRQREQQQRERQSRENSQFMNSWMRRQLSAPPTTFVPPSDPVTDQRNWQLRKPYYMANRFRVFEQDARTGAYRLPYDEEIRAREGDGA